MTARRGPLSWAALVAAVLAQCALLLALHGRAARGPISDFDSPWHLTCGRLILETASVPRQDALAFTTGGADWINLNWLAQAGLYRAFLAAGWTGPVVLAAVAFAVALAATLDRLRARRVAGAVAVAAAALAAWFLTAGHSLRPQTFTLALLAGSAWLLDRPDPERRLGPGRAALLAAALAVWSNLHGGFLFGYALLGLDALGSALDARRAGGGWLPARSRWLLGACAAGAVAGFGLHPHGLAALGHALDYERTVGPRLLETVHELQPLRLGTPLGAATALLVGAFAAGAVAARAHVAARDLLPLLLFAGLALRVQRAALPLAVVALPAAAMLVTRALEGARPRAPRLEAFLQANLAWSPRLLLAATAAWAVAALALARPGVPGDLDPAWLDPPGRPTPNPVGALEHLRRVHPEGRVFNAWLAGGLLEWATYPRRRAFIDGRGDLHHLAGSFEAWERVITLGPGWSETLDAWRVDLALLSADRERSRLTAALEAAGWRASWDDGRWVVLVRPAPR